MVIDNQGAREGIGSRFFTVSNGAGRGDGGSGGERDRARRSPTAEAIAAAPLGRGGLVLGRRGWDLAAPWRPFAAGRVGPRGRAQRRGQSRRVARSAAGGARTRGTCARATGSAPLPIGSHLDATTGVFTWAPGVGFVGAYDFVFVRWTGRAAVARQRGARSSWRRRAAARSAPQVVIDTPRSQQDVGQPFVLGGWAADLNAAHGHGDRDAARVGVSAGRRAAGVPRRDDATAARGRTSRRCTATSSATSGFGLVGPGTDARELRPRGVRVEHGARGLRAGEGGARDGAVVDASCDRWCQRCNSRPAVQLARLSGGRHMTRTIALAASLVALLVGVASPSSARAVGARRFQSGREQLRPRPSGTGRREDSGRRRFHDTRGRRQHAPRAHRAAQSRRLARRGVQSGRERLSVLAWPSSPTGRSWSGGVFTTTGRRGTRHDGAQFLARLHPDGTLDATFSPGANDAVLTLAVQPDGKILVGGWFTRLGRRGDRHDPAQPYRAAPSRWLARYHLQSGSGRSRPEVAVQPDGRILVGGWFATLGGGGDRREHGLGGSIPTARSTPRSTLARATSTG